MKCSEYQDLISAYVDGMLDPQEEKELLSHLKVCACCKENYEALKQIIVGCEHIEEVEVPETFHQNMMKRLEDIETEKKIVPIKKHWKWQYGGALVASLIVGGLFISQLNGLTQPNKAENGVATCEISELTVDQPEMVKDKNVITSNNQNARTRENAKTDTKSEAEILIDKDLGQESINQSIFCEIKVNDILGFKEQLEVFLEAGQVNYQKTERGYWISQSTQNEQVLEWLQANSKQIIWDVKEHSQLQNSDLDLKITE